MLDQLTRSILQLLPSDTSEELKNNIDALVQGRFEQMNLATREQLEIQEKILRRTKEGIPMEDRLLPFAHCQHPR